MKIDNINNYINGWYIGAFNPAIIHTNNFEVAYKKHHKLEIYEKHYHKKTIEINLLIKGCMTIQDRILNTGDIFIMYPYEISDPIFHTDCEVLIIRFPSIPDDKYIIQEN